VLAADAGEGWQSHKILSKVSAMEICVFEVDWKVFETTFPKPGDWMEVCDSQIDFDDFSFNMECASIYGRIRSKLDEDIVLAVDQLFSAVGINGVPKKWNQSTLYKPAVIFDKDQFQFACDGPVIPRSSPVQVSQILETFAVLPKGKLDEGIKANWAKAKAELVESPKEFASYIKNWIKVIKAIKKAGKGLAIDLM
jgi:hypothetical protein